MSNNQKFNELINNEYLSSSILYSLQAFFYNDDFLLPGKKGRRSVYEVAISCKIGLYLYIKLNEFNFFNKLEYKGFNLDIEYNKMGINKEDKIIHGISKICTRNKTDKIRPDIIIHKRGQEGENNNLIVFEIKKGSLSKCDIAKLKAFTNINEKKFQYQYGIGLSNFKNGDENNVKITLYIDGEEESVFHYNYKNDEIIEDKNN